VLSEKKVTLLHKAPQNQTQQTIFTMKKPRLHTTTKQRQGGRCVVVSHRVIFVDVATTFWSVFD